MSAYRISIICDGCGENISWSSRLRLNSLTPTAPYRRGDRWYVDRLEQSWDFCSVGCATTWAVQEEMKTAGG